MAKSNISGLETKMNEVFVGKAPTLPAGGKKFLVDVAPWLSLIGGVLSLLVGLSLWRWAHVATDYVNSLCNAYAISAGACDNSSTSRLSLLVWLAIIVLIIEGVLYLLAFPGLRDRKKQGWNYLFYAGLVNVVYVIVSLFTDYSASGGFIGSLLGSLVGFWLLFQVRSAYTGHKAVEPKV